MENANNDMFGGYGIFGIIIFLIVAGMFTGNGWGFGGNNARADITNEFLYNQLANDVRANGTAINTVDRDVLTSSCNTDKEILENRYQNALQTQTLSSQMSSCCCEIKGLIRDEIQSVKDLINNNTIQDLRDAKQGYELVSALGNQTNTLSTRFGSWFPNPPYTPYYYGTYGYNGTTIV